jgi:NAD(P)-dependent dehydrogenase (short-subunit alcohol dehydrogenase family)
MPAQAHLNTQESTTMSADNLNKPLHGRRALVTGGNRGIGRAIALKLADQGCDVAITYNRGQTQAEAVAAELRALAVSSQTFVLQLEEPQDYRVLVEQVNGSFGAIDMLISNAGIDFRGCPVADTPIDEVRQMMQVNAVAPHALSAAFIPTLRRAPRSDIVFISSMVTAMYGPRFAPYGMSKAALEALAFCLAKEERSHNMHVNVVAPGLVDTDMGARFTGNANAGAARDLITASLPYGRICQPAEVADAVAYFVGPGASYVNGQRVYVDGGGSLL